MTVPTDEAPALLCPACGFDLRATVSDRCGECGLPFDRALLTVSGIPWAHRHTMGRFRAYLKTVWQITQDSKSIRHEAAKPQELSDGRSFRRVSAWILAAALLAAFGMIVYLQHGLAFLAIQPLDPTEVLGMGAQPPKLNRHFYELAVPWCAAATFAPVLPLCIILFAFWLTGAQRFIFRVPASYAAQQRERALCLSHYTTAPLIFLLPCVLLLIIAALISRNLGERDLQSMSAITLTLNFIGIAIFLFALIATFSRSAKWLMRTRHCGLGAALLAQLELLSLWLLGTVVLLGLFPWCGGFLWIVLDSLR